MIIRYMIIRYMIIRYMIIRYMIIRYMIIRYMIKFSSVNSKTSSFHKYFVAMKYR